MPWIRRGSKRSPGAKRLSRAACGLLALSAILLSAILLSGAAPEKRLSIYSVAANYTLPLVQREGRDYVGLLEVLEPLGKVSARYDGTHWRLRYNRVDGEFQVERGRARIQGRDLDLPAKFIVGN